MVSLYWKSYWLKLFSDYHSHFMLLGLACFYTVIKLCHHIFTIENLKNSMEANLDSLALRLLLTDNVDVIISKIVKARYKWYDCLDDLHSKNKEIRLVGRRLDHRKNQARMSCQDLDELIMSYRGRDVVKNREAVDILIIEQDKSLQEVKENIVDMHHEEIDLNGKVSNLKQEMEHLNETIENLERPIDEFDSIKPNIHGCAVEPNEFEAFLSSNIEYLSMLERITIMREMTYSRSIFFNALQQNNGQISERLFNQLILRLPKSLRDTCERTRVRYKDYRSVLSKRKLGWTNYGGMDKASVTRFLKDLEAEAFQVESWYSSNMPDPGRIGYEIEVDEQALEEEDGDGEEMQQHMSLFLTSDDEEDEEDIEEKQVFVITSI